MLKYCSGISHRAPTTKNALSIDAQGVRAHRNGAPGTLNFIVAQLFSKANHPSLTSWRFFLSPSCFISVDSGFGHCTSVSQREHLIVTVVPNPSTSHSSR